MVDVARGDFGGASFGGGYSDPNVTGEPSTPDIHGIGGNQGGPLGGGYAGALGPPAAGPMANIGGPAGGQGYDNMGNVSMPGGPIGGTSGGTYNANNMGTGTGFPDSPYGEFGPQQGMGYAPPDSPYGEFGPPQAGGYNMPGDVEGGGGEPLIMRLQGLTPEQQNFLLNNPDALRAFNQEYNRILQSGQGGQVGVGWSNDDSYTHGQYRVPPNGLISQGTSNREWQSDL